MALKREFSPSGERPRGQQQLASRVSGFRHGAADGHPRPNLRHRRGGADLLGGRRPNAVVRRAPSPRLTPEPRSGSGATDLGHRPRTPGGDP
jgi:hypothetical protein